MVEAFKIDAFQIPKAGCQLEECEDAFFWDETQRLFAIADGATDSAFQRLWAELLVKGFISNPPTFSPRSAFEEWFKGWIETQQLKWNESIDWNKLPWHGLNKARQTGALATFLGIRFSSQFNRWDITAIGDCNLFIFRQDATFFRCYPVCESSAFGISPFALSSINQNYGRQLKEVKVAKISYHSGDFIILATDALAAWCLSQIELRENPLKRLLSVTGNDDFSILIDSLRHKGQIRNDDTSLLIIRSDTPDV